MNMMRLPLCFRLFRSSTGTDGCYYFGIRFNLESVYQATMIENTAKYPVRCVNKN